MKKTNKKIIRNFAIMLFAVLLFPAHTILAKTGSWGLTYPKPGSTPRGGESVEYLKKYDAYFVGEENEKVVYLTFDAGYENGYTESILDTLKKNEVPAAFFLVGSYIKNQPELVKRMVDEGHIVGNHTMRHPDMSAIKDKAAFAKELTQVEEIYKTVTEREMPKFYRPPMGKYSDMNLQAAKDLGYKTIFWGMAYVDWEDKNQPTKEQAFSKLIPRLHPGAVLLLHSTSKTNSVILEELINKYRELGYEFKSLKHLIGEQSEESESTETAKTNSAILESFVKNYRPFGFGFKDSELSDTEQSTEFENTAD